MGAQSVTGTGPGSAEGKTKGNIRQTLGKERVLGLDDVIANAGSGDIVIKGTATLSSTAQEKYTWPKLEGSASDYILIVSSNGSNIVANQLTIDATATNVFLQGLGGEFVSYMVVKK